MELGGRRKSGDTSSASVSSIRSVINKQITVRKMKSKDNSNNSGGPITII